MLQERGHALERLLVLADPCRHARQRLPERARIARAAKQNGELVAGADGQGLEQPIPRHHSKINLEPIDAQCAIRRAGGIQHAVNRRRQDGAERGRQLRMELACGRLVVYLQLDALPRDPVPRCAHLLLHTQRRSRTIASVLRTPVSFNVAPAQVAFTLSAVTPAAFRVSTARAISLERSAGRVSGFDRATRSRYAAVTAPSAA